MRIALIGKARTGKDTVGEYLINNYNCFRFAFGDAVGEVVKRYFPDSYAQGKPREHYQVVGQSFRQLNPDIWIERTALSINSLLAEVPTANIVVTDVRQPNEAKYLKEEGFLLVKIVCPDTKRIERMSITGDNYRAEQLTHETELNVDNCEYDICITNDGSLADLNKKIESIITYYETEFQRVLDFRRENKYYIEELMRT